MRGIERRSGWKTTGGVVLVWSLEERNRDVMVSKLPLYPGPSANEIVSALSKIFPDEHDGGWETDPSMNSAVKPQIIPGKNERRPWWWSTVLT